MFLMFGYPVIWKKKLDMFNKPLLKENTVNEPISRFYSIVLKKCSLTFFPFWFGANKIASENHSLGSHHTKNKSSKTVFMYKKSTAFLCHSLVTILLHPLNAEAKLCWCSAPQLHCIYLIVLSWLFPCGTVWIRSVAQMSYVQLNECDCDKLGC